MSADQASRSSLGALRNVPYMGVIWVVAEAEKLGFSNGDPDWCNLGQGQPEIGELAGAPARYSEFKVEPIDHAYGPVNGLLELRERVADQYNRTFRQGKASQYTADNVAIASGGRLALSRSVFALGNVRIGYQVPDYTAYEDMLGAQMPRYTPVPIFAQESDGFALPGDRLARAIDDQSLDAFIISNPCNPTGVSVRGDDLASWVSISREKGTTLLLDEFYSHFTYADGGGPADGPVSGAAYVGDVNEDPVLLFDGLTKNWRYPGWRIGWVVGPKAMIEMMTTSGSSIDGGPSRIMQRAAIDVLEPGRADQETAAVRAEFAIKRDLLVERLESMGIRFARRPDSTFYAWGSIAELPEPFNDCFEFFHRALAKKVMVVPGPFFDIDPGKERHGPSPLNQWLRFSFGPPRENVELGLDRLESLLKG